MDINRGLLDLMIEHIPKLNSRNKLALCQKCNGEADLALLSKEDIERFLQKALPPWNMDDLRFQAEKDAREAERNGIGYVSYMEDAYPPLLRELYDPPALLFYRGTLPDPRLPMAAIVGTRKPSGNAAVLAYDTGKALGRGGIPVVSGLALGIDAMAHRGNLDGKAPTVAVLGSGLDRIYPAANRVLARRILEQGGVLLSEYPPGTEPFKWNFPARNRIIAGLARGTLIVEAPAKSGALISAGFALDLGRDLWVSQIGVRSPLGEGTRKLAEDGAQVISGADAIFAEWGMEVNRETVDTVSTSGPAISLARSLNLEVRG
ncbi:DNA processing protein DprA [Spirochaetia bacterium]|nr:DNA processing protein DprA [Spirochaetia bacterium]